jgi:hypothetical protein
MFVCLYVLTDVFRGLDYIAKLLYVDSTSKGERELWTVLASFQEPIEVGYNIDLTSFSRV